MTSNIVTDFFLYLAIASIGAAATYGAWRLLLDKPERTAARHILNRVEE